MTKEKLIGLVIDVAVILMAAAIPFGAAMAIYSGNSDWLFLCAFLVIFLS